MSRPHSMTPTGSHSVTENLEVLVARTAGSQPWRKAFHAANGLLIAFALTVADASTRMPLLALAALSTALLATDVARLALPEANVLFFKAFGRLASPREARGIASSTWYVVGVSAAVALFPRSAAISGVLVLALADPAAAFVGRKLGTRPFLGGTFEGSLAFFGTSALILALRHPWPIALVAAALTTVAERRSWPLDDNLAIPLVSAGTVVALTWLRGSALF
jgi:dolichol kinase